MYKFQIIGSSKALLNFHVQINISGKWIVFCFVSKYVIVLVFIFLPHSLHSKTFVRHTLQPIISCKSFLAVCFISFHFFCKILPLFSMSPTITFFLLFTSFIHFMYFPFLHIFLLLPSSVLKISATSTALYDLVRCAAC